LHLKAEAGDVFEKFPAGTV